jgi:hypothetical protein
MASLFETFLRYLTKADGCVGDMYRDQLQYMGLAGLGAGATLQKSSVGCIDALVEREVE